MWATTAIEQAPFVNAGPGCRDDWVRFQLDYPGSVGAAWIKPGFFGATLPGRLRQFVLVMAEGRMAALHQIVRQ